MAVVSGDSWSGVRQLLKEQRLPRGGRGPLRGRTDGQHGLGSGPPGSRVAPPPVLQAGGQALFAQQSPIFNTIERLRRSLPEEGWFEETMSPDKPYIWTILSYEVPEGQSLWLTDYEFSVGRQSGIDAGDFVYAEDGRFSGVMAFDVNINGLTRTNNLAYGLDPQPIPLDRQEFDVPVRGIIIEAGATPAEFSTAAAQSFASPAGVGNSALPVRPNVQGARKGPFTLVVGENNTVVLRGIVFRPVRTPIAFVEARFGGFTLHTNLSETLIERMRPA